jgi:hypothetical protein
VKAKPSAHLKMLYNMFNALYFRDRLPKGTRLYFVSKVGRSKSIAKSACAATYLFDPPVIVIQKSKAKSMRYVSADLLHEMAHISKPRAEHGKVFQKEMKRLANAGAFQNVW